MRFIVRKRIVPIAQPPDRRKGLVYNRINHFHCQIGQAVQDSPALRRMTFPMSLLDVS